MRLPNVEIQTAYAKFDGGLDQETPVLSIAPGAVIAALNYYVGPRGGYTRIDGYERLDGRPAPSEATYYYATFTNISAAVGQAVQGNTSGATGVVALLGAGYIILTKVVGTFVSGETLKAGGGGLPLLLTMTYTKTTVGTLTSTLGSAPTGILGAQAQNAAADIYRLDIGKVPGSGPIRGAWTYKGVKYAFRDSLDGTAGTMYKATAAGWEQVDLGRELEFTAGGTYVPQDGDTITGNISGATAVIGRCALESGDFESASGVGRFVFASQTGTFTAETVSIGANAAVATIAGDSDPITLLPGGRYDFDNSNFFGSSATIRMYGCDGVNRGFEFDGTTYVPINTGMEEDAPQYVHCHKLQLFFFFAGGSVQNAGVGTPYQWEAVVGASEIGIGDEVTGALSQAGDALIIFARDSTHQLLGSTIDDFVLKPAAPEVGAIPRTAQNVVGQTYSFDDRGITQLVRSAEYGNFNAATVTEHVQPTIDVLRSKIVASTVYKRLNQYRVYASDGSGLVMTVSGNKVRGVMPFQYPVNVTCASHGEDETGADIALFGDDSGYLYQADRGSSFDGEEIESYLILPFNNLKTPRLRKRFRKVVQEMSAVAYTAIRFNPIFSYGDENIATHPLITKAVQGGGGLWDVALWDRFFWDSRLVSTPEFKVDGTGLNMALVYYGKSDIDLGHTLQGAILHYTPRRLQR